MESSSTTDTPSATTSVLPKACENCRIRKIRCNRTIPCSNCETSGIACRPAAKSTEQRSRVLLSANYEKQIEQINDRLSGIEDALKHLRVEKSTTPQTLPESISSTTTTTSEQTRTNLPTPSAFEGASSFTSQALRASQAAERSLETIQRSAEVIDALTCLRKLTKPGTNTGANQSLRLGNGIALPRQFPDIQILPQNFVLAILQEFKGRTTALMLAYAFRDYRQTERLCQQVYFPTEPVTMAGLTLMNGMLLYMIKELMWDGDVGLSKRFDLQALHDQAERNFLLGVETYEVLTQPSLESAKVMVLATLKAQEEGKPLLTWTFVSTGARQVISLGYHRRSSMKNDSFEVAEDKRQIFWTLYMVDKNLSLNMGYSPTIQDYDIDVEYFQCSQDPGVAPWDKAALAMVEMARIQGLIFERLYSLQALSSSPETKAQVIDDLYPQLQKWHLDWSQVKSDQAYLPTFFFLIYGAFDVVYYSVVTTLHRAAGPSNSSVEITSACYEAAKKSLQAHLHFFPAFKSYGDLEILASYMAWILLYCSWTPLIVVFLHAIASLSTDDVRLLEETAESLDPIKHLNQQSEQVCGLAKIFAKLAKVYVERHSTFPGTYNSQEDMVVMPQTDMQGRDQNYMMMPQGMPYQPQMAGAEFHAPAFDGSEMDGMSMFLGNWLGGQQPVANLWNMDFTDNIE